MLAIDVNWCVLSADHFECGERAERPQAEVPRLARQDSGARQSSHHNSMHQSEQVSPPTTTLCTRASR